MLSMTKVEIDLISDFGIYLFFEEGMRAGVFYIYKNIAKQAIYIKHPMIASYDNRYLTSNKYKSNKIYCILGKKKLYGYAISKSLPTGGYKWLDPAKFNLDKNGDGSLIGRFE